ncbi:cytochrome P450 [Pochonia chlamydosporia 170]|uniref:Cytochrome P450 n=1 Tax=Pochonia chlamydosporia 170 TaxID=1380566 RepID=A0A179FKM4_METCM|nr:cytochrome P450 [Pochonia chlamydosporia 170]OAQ66104.1 cytochrome P450 [Pochonia chlamydosporia 170]
MSAAGLALVLGCCFIIARLFNSYRHLSFIPGPFAAKFTDLWRYHSQNSNAYAERLVTLHKKHGKLVRIGPNHISVSDPSAIPIVYSTNPTWQKGPSYYGAVPVSKNRAVPTVIGMNETQHTAVRKSVGRAFTTNSLLDYEDSIEVTGLELIQALRKQKKVDIGEWLQFFAMDMLIRITFSNSLGLLAGGQDVDGTLAAVMARFDHWGHWGALPTADFAINKSRFATALRGVSDSPLARVAQSKLDTRERDVNQSAYKDLCAKFLDGQAKYPQLVQQDEILGIIMSTIGAGADTTAGTLTYTLYFLSKYPATRTKLLQEIQSGLEHGTLSRTPKWAEVKGMPYLDAVLKESMRILPIASWGLDRIVPPGGATIAGQFIPGGTVVGCQIDAVHLDEDVFGNDASTFRPERWLETSEEHRRQMDRAFLAFSAGKRTCTGVHIAWLEMKKTLPLLLMNFELDLVNPDQDVRDGIRISAVKYPPPVMMKVRSRSFVTAS